MHYKVHEITGKYAIAPKDGQELYDLIFPLIQSGEVVELDFSDIKVVTTAFFNVSTGMLLKDFSRNDLNRQIHVTGLDSDSQNILQQVMDNAEHYYTDPSYKKAVDTVMEEYFANC
jgi:STAS-like domain of unknown function (DUF4325)